jgi:hypothetical protein
MIRLQWKRFAIRRESNTGKSSRPRALTKQSPRCEALDSRWLLSTVPAVSLSSLPAAAVANAATRLDGLAPATFAQFESVLARAGNHSRVTQAQVNKLLQDEAALDQAIQSAGLDSSTASGDIGHVQDEVDGAFIETTYQADGWANKREELDQYLSGVPGATQLVQRTIEQMHVVARAARVTPHIHDALSADWLVFKDDLGPTPDTDLGPGATDRDPLEVYYNGQIDKFIKYPPICDFAMLPAPALSRSRSEIVGEWNTVELTAGRCPFHSQRVSIDPHQCTRCWHASKAPARHRPSRRGGCREPG